MESVATPTYYTFADTPAGMLLLTSNGTAITGMHWKVFKRAPPVQAGWIADGTPFAALLQQLDEYFAGRRQTFDIATAVTGTAFQMEVWRALAEIPYGTACTYRDIAIKVGRPLAVRAVGTAVGSNPMSIIVPCHRVLAAGQRNTGYAGGVAGKSLLLTLEKIPHF